MALNHQQEPAASGSKWLLCRLGHQASRALALELDRYLRDLHLVDCLFEISIARHQHHSNCVATAWDVGAGAGPAQGVGDQAVGDIVVARDVPAKTVVACSCSRKKV